MRLALSLALVAVPAVGLAQTRHPLEPLTAAEVTRSSRSIKSDPRWTPTTQFAEIRLIEPAKPEILGWRPGQAVGRRALSILTDPRAGKTSEVTVDLQNGAIAEWREVPGGQTWITRWSTDNDVATEILRAEPRWVAALTRRGLRPDQVTVLAAPAEGYLPFERDGTRRVAALTMLAGPERDGSLDGLLVLVNLTRRTIESFEDRGGPNVRVPNVEIDSIRRLATTRRGPKPLRLLQPEGPSFTVSGHAVSWQNWEFRFSVESRSGLILHQVGYRDGAQVRPILFRAAVSEMAVPYGDPGWRIWMPLDLGWVGLGGYSQTSFRAGADVPENARFFESVMHDGAGNPVVVPRSVALYERDPGVLWRHGTEARRGRELVLAFFATVDNYDYAFNWVFQQDGTLASEVMLTGMMNTRPIDQARAADHGEGPAYGTLVAPNVFAPNHQHFFNFRLDFDIDGAAPNRVVEMNVAGERSPPGRPDALGHVETTLDHEQSATRQVNMLSHRMWRIVNPAHHNRLGHATSYALLPGDNTTPMMPRGAFIRERVGFVNNHLWVTPFAERELYAAGDYAWLGRHGDGLPTWTAADRNLVDTDVVVWYTLGVTHVPRPEDWPVMPVVKTGFKLVPIGFFSENPALGLPR